MEQVPRYLQKLLEQGFLIEPGELTEIDVLHDDWCDLLDKPAGECNCNPVLKKRPLEKASQLYKYIRTRSSEIKHE